MDEVIKDDRFSHIAKDPRFRQIKNNERKVKIGKRFQGMFKDKNFKLKYTVDKRGRPVKQTTSENLKKYYDMSDSDSEEETPEPKKKKAKKGKTDIIDNISNQTEKDESKYNRKKKKDEDSVGKTMTGNSASPLKSKVTERTKQLKKLTTCTAAKMQTVSSHSEEESSSEETNNADDDSKLLDNAEDEDSEESESAELGESIMDLARGRGTVESSEDEDEEEVDFKEDDFDHQWGETDKNAPTVEEATSRLAVCNMDWDRIKAADLMVLFNSFVPAGGVIKEVAIYPSEFGQQRMKEEEERGPVELTEKKKEDNVNDDDEASEYHREKLRQYQLNRLKYYYAVVVCDTTQTANRIYEECDGKEYESSSTRLDLRFVPEEMEFDAAPKDRALKVPDASTYKPSLFANTALQQSNVKLTWDETPQDRVAVTMRMYKPDEIEDVDLKAYLASSSDEEGDVVEEGVKEEEDVQEEEGVEGVEEESEEAQIQKYRDLLKGLKDDEQKKQKKDLDMEITWEPGLTSTTKTIVSQKEKAREKLTPWEKYLEKKKEKTKKKLDKRKPSKYQKEEGHRAINSEDSDDYIPEGVDMNDSYFKDELDKMTDDTKKETKSKKQKKRKSDKTDADIKGEAEMGLLTMDEDDQRQHFSLNKILKSEELNAEKKSKKKRRKGNEINKQASAELSDNFKIKVDDSRFGAIFENHLYNIDPSAPEFKKTKAMESLMEEKLKRRKSKGGHGQKTDHMKAASTLNKSDSKDQPLASKTDPMLASLVRSVKAKTQRLEEKKSKHKGTL